MRVMEKFKKVANAALKWLKVALQQTCEKLVLQVFSIQICEIPDNF